jgi:hypothetical protein
MKHKDKSYHKKTKIPNDLSVDKKIDSIIIKA